MLTLEINGEIATAGKILNVNEQSVSMLEKNLSNPQRDGVLLTAAHSRLLFI